MRFPLTSGPYAGPGVAADLDHHALDAGLQRARRRQGRRHLRHRHQRQRDPRRGRAARRAGARRRLDGAGPIHRRRHGRLDVPAALRDRRVARAVSTGPARAPRPLRGHRGLRHHHRRHRTRAPVPRVRRGRLRLGAPQRHRDGQPHRRGRPLRGRPRPRRRRSSSATRTTPCSPTSPSAACCSARCRTSTPTRTAGGATRRSCTTPCRPGTSAPRPSRTTCSRRTRPPTGSRHDQARPLRRLAEQQHRLGAVAQPLLGHPAADLAQRRGPVADGLRRVAGAAVRAHRSRPVRPRPAPAVHRRDHVRDRRRAGHLPARPRGHRRLVRLRLHAVRAVGIPARPRARRRSSSAPTRRSTSARPSTRPAAGSTR